MRFAAQSALVYARWEIEATKGREWSQEMVRKGFKSGNSSNHLPSYLSLRPEISNIKKVRMMTPFRFCAGYA
jgi:hypothetical protein